MLPPPSSGMRPQRVSHDFSQTHPAKAGHSGPSCPHTAKIHQPPQRIRRNPWTEWKSYKRGRQLIFIKIPVRQLPQEFRAFFRPVKLLRKRLYSAGVLAPMKPLLSSVGMSDELNSRAPFVRKCKKASPSRLSDASPADTVPDPAEYLVIDRSSKLRKSVRTLGSFRRRK